MESITRPTNPRLKNFPSFLDALDNKRALYVHRFPHDKKGLKVNPLPCKPINRKPKRNAIMNQNFPSFISSNGRLIHLHKDQALASKWKEGQDLQILWGENKNFRQPYESHDDQN